MVPVPFSPKSSRIRFPKGSSRSEIHRHPIYYALRNHLVDFLVSRSKIFADTFRSHDPRRPSCAQIGAMGPLNVFTNDELSRRVASDFHVKPALYLNDRDVRGG
jgi:hypothetical protein